MKNNALWAVALTLLLGHPSAAIAGKIMQSNLDPFRPLAIQSTSAPLNMLVLGRDHKLWYEAYNDASDLMETGVYDVGYKGWKLLNATEGAKQGNFYIDYYGYFDSYTCYTYNATNHRFEPSEKTATKKCTSKWSGDFLNYLTTSRMDALRKVLYGGTRSTDTATETVLRRAYIPQDAHSWGKEYTSQAVDGYLISDYTPLAAPSANKRHLFANTTANGTNGGIANLPLLRFLPNRAERVWNWVSKNAPVSGTTITTATGEDTVSFTENRTTLTDSLKGGFWNVQVQVCKSATLKEDNCKQYGTSWKPTGLLQQYGDSDAMRFGLLTGSYSKNLAGGVLRKNIGQFSDEVDASNGVFLKPAKGIVTALDALRIHGFGSGNSYDCGWNFAAKELENGNCLSWGNPVGEMLEETMRYYAGGSATSSFTGDSAGTGIGVPEETTWLNPYRSTSSGGNDICAKPYVTLISDINPSWDSDNLTGSVGGQTINYSSRGSALWTSEFGGSGSAILGGVTGNIDGAPTAKTLSNFNNVRGLPEEPNKKGSYSSALVADFARNNAFISANNRLRVATFAVALASPLPVIKVPVGTGANKHVVTLTPFAKSVGNFGITNTKGQYQPTNQIVDFYIDTIVNIGGGFPNDASINGGRPYYKFRINYEDVEYGADHDMDAIGEYTIQLTADNQVEVTVASTYASGSIIQHLGYTVSGTTADGPYLVVRDCDTAPKVTGEPSQCVFTADAGVASDVSYWLDKPATGYPKSNPTRGLPMLDTRRFVPSTTASALVDLKDPLWYVGKWGGTDPADWDKDNNQTPDSYFLVTNPLKLQEQLSKAFASLDSNARNAQIGAGAGGGSENSQRLYKADYIQERWSGDLTAYINSGMDFGEVAWRATDKLLAPNNRVMVSWRYSDNTGVAFRPASYQSSAAPQNLSANLINYLRGDNTNESKTGFRQRQQVGGQSNYYGDILDSRPMAIMGGPSPEYRPDDAGYSDYAETNANRKQAVYFGANDGTLHAIDDSYDVNTLKPGTNAGKEILAYVPGFLFSKLSKLSEQNYQHQFYVNGQTSVQDVQTTSAADSWKTMLVGSPGFGGKGIFALDITDPALFSESNAASLALWEFSSADDADMGYSPGSAVMVKTNDGKWRAITGNGYNSTTGKAVLFLLEARGPNNGSWTNRMVKIDTGVGDNTAAAHFNGLSAPTFADLDNNGTVDVVYAGDLKGNLWKFDLRSKNPADWGVAFSGAPLYTAIGADDKPQPIANWPEVAFHPTQNQVQSSNGVVTSDGHLLVFFGTGKFFEDCDPELNCEGESNSNAFYAIWDKGEPVTASDTLLERCYGNFTQSDVDAYNADLAASAQIRLSDVRNLLRLQPCAGKTEIGNIDWTTDKGWFMKMKGSYPRMAGSPRIVGGTVVFNFTNLTSTSGNECTINGETTTMALDFANGGQSENRFGAQTVNGKLAALANVGVVQSVFLPGGTTTLINQRPAGINDDNGGGRDYGAKHRPKTCIAKGSPTGTDTQSARCMIVPVNWKEILK